MFPSRCETHCMHQSCTCPCWGVQRCRSCNVCPVKKFTPSRIVKGSKPIDPYISLWWYIAPLQTNQFIYLSDLASTSEWSLGFLPFTKHHIDTPLKWPAAAAMIHNTPVFMFEKRCSMSTFHEELVQQGTIGAMFMWEEKNEYRALPTLITWLPSIRRDKLQLLKFWGFSSPLVRRSKGQSW